MGEIAEGGVALDATETKDFIEEGEHVAEDVGGVVGDGGVGGKGHPGKVEGVETTGDVEDGMDGGEVGEDLFIERGLDGETLTRGDVLLHDGLAGVFELGFVCGEVSLFELMVPIDVGHVVVLIDGADLVEFGFGGFEGEFVGGVALEGLDGEFLDEVGIDALVFFAGLDGGDDAGDGVVLGHDSIQGVPSWASRSSSWVMKRRLWMVARR